MNAGFEKLIESCFTGEAGLFNISAMSACGDAGVRRVADFMLALSGDRSKRASICGDSDLANFLAMAFERIEGEVDDAVGTYRDFASALDSARYGDCDRKALRSILLPESAGLPEDVDKRVGALRESRLVEISHLNSRPITDPAGEILFTANALLTVPATAEDLSALQIDAALKEQVCAAMAEPQVYWYDHPVQIGVALEANEILYGLRGLEQMAEFEIARGNMREDQRVTCAISVSVTHRSLHAVAREYVESEIERAGGFEHVEVYVFTEDDTLAMVEDVFVEAGDDPELLGVFGVDGEYGRHYSFLKAISALWQVAVDPRVRATFKIDLDQVFPQRELVQQTGRSAFEQFMNPLWGALGVDSSGDAVELGMIAGGLVNEGDIARGVFTPDVEFRAEPKSLEEEVFFSSMLMGLSTRAELATVYNGSNIDGVSRCIQRVHVTGGTNGVLVESLRRHRPFTPSFIGRAEDQAYLLSVLLEQPPRLRYYHADGLRMRHDKQAFALESIRAASFGNLVGDHIRTIYFSAYARALAGSRIADVKRLLDPFTGCFISRIPATVVLLRFCARAAQFMREGDPDRCADYIESSSPRLENAFRFAEQELPDRCERERAGWNQYYDILDRIEGKPEITSAARAIIDGCRIAP